MSEERLVALFPILFRNKQYEPGEELPTTDPAYVFAWIEAGSAVWKNGSDGGEENAEAKKPAKAHLKTAPAGITGTAQPATGAEPDLAGRVPSRKGRGVAPEKARRPAKSQT